MLPNETFGILSNFANEGIVLGLDYGSLFEPGKRITCSPRKMCCVGDKTGHSANTARRARFSSECGRKSTVW